MLTGRAWFFLFIILGLLPVSLGLGARPLTITLLTLLAWLLLSWLAFQVRLRLALPQLRIVRTLHDPHGPISSPWAGQAVRVQAELSNDSRVSLPFAIAVDRLPLLAQWKQGDVFDEGTLARGRPLLTNYWIDCPAAGTLRFDGLKLQLTDLNGLFYHVTFVRDVRTFRVLPALASARGRVPAAKRNNLLPLLGTHPHRRPGSGSELLDLRDYQTGDPPKLIAWKLSARRERLITKVFESETPIRCTLFVDQSDSVRVGPPGRNGLARLITIASAVLQAGGAARDLLGLVQFDEDGVTGVLRPARGRSHLAQAMRSLSEAGALQPRANPVALERLLPLGCALAQDIYPDLMDAEVNAFPPWLPWLFPQPAYTLPRVLPPGRSFPRRCWDWLVQKWRESPLGRSARGGWPWSPRYHRLYRFRKKLAAILSVRYGLAPGGLALLLEDDDALRHFLLRFLAEHQVQYPLAFYDPAGRYAFAAPHKVQALADALLASVFRGRDDELFVLLVDLLEARGPEVERLLNAVRVARARHHQVLIVQPWPAGVALPKRGDKAPHPGGPISSLYDLLMQTDSWRLHQAYADVESRFAAAGTKVICAAQGDAAALILHRLERLRTMQRGVG